MFDEFLEHDIKGWICELVYFKGFKNYFEISFSNFLLFFFNFDLVKILNPSLINASFHNFGWSTTTLLIRPRNTKEKTSGS